VQKFAAFSCNACKPDGGIFAEKFFASAATRANPARKLYVQNLCPRTPPLRPEWAPNVLRHKGAHFMVVRGKKQKAEVPRRQRASGTSATKKSSCTLQH